MLEIPLRPLPADSLTITLGLNVFKIYTEWNSRDECWYFSIYTGTDVPIVTGIRMLQTANLTGRHGTLPLIDGDIYSVNKNISQARPVFEDLGKNLTLYYLTKAETAFLRSLGDATDVMYI